MYGVKHLSWEKAFQTFIKYLWEDMLIFIILYLLCEMEGYKKNVFTSETKTVYLSSSGFFLVFNKYDKCIHRIFT